MPNYMFGGNARAAIAPFLFSTNTSAAKSNHNGSFDAPSISGRQPTLY